MSETITRPVTRPKTAPPPAGAGPTRPTLRQRLSILDVKASPYLYIAPFFILFGLVGLFPLLFTAYVSLFNWDLLDERGTFIGLRNYVDLFHDTQFWKSLVNTISIFVLSSGPQIVISVLLAAMLNTKLRATTGWRVGVLVPYVASLVAVGIIFGNLFGVQFGLVNSVLDLLGLDRVNWQNDRLSSHVAIATMVNWRWTGYNTLILLAAMQAVPRDMIEAAVVDGAGAIRRFFSIVLPMLRPTMIFVIVTSSIGGLQIFTEPKLFSELPGSSNGGASNQFQTVTLYMYQSGFETQELGYASAIAWALFLVIAVVAVFNFLLTKRIASGGEVDR